MKKFLLALTLTLIGVFYLTNAVCEETGFSSTLSAENFYLTDISLDERINLGVNCSVVLPAEDEAETGVYVGGLLSFDIIKYLAVGIEVGYARYDFEVEDIDIGTLNGCPLLADVILKAPVEIGEFTLTPYGIVGTGVLFSSFDESGFVEGLGVDIDTETAFLMKFGGGLDLYVTDNIALNFEGSYYLVDIDLDANWAGQTIATDTLDADSWLIGGGLKVRF